MGIFEHFPYLNFHDINLDWLLKQTKKNADDNAKLMKIFKDVEDQGIIGVVTDVTENPDDTVKIDYYDNDSDTFDDFTVYNKTGADTAISGAQSAAESYADSAASAAAANALKSLGDLTQETTLQNTDLLLINRSGAAKSIDGSLIAKQSDMTTAQNDISSLQSDVLALQTRSVVGAIASNTSMTLNTAINGRWLVYVFASDQKAIYMVTTTSQNVVNATAVVETALLSISTTTGSFTINNTSTRSCTVYIDVFAGSVPTV